MLTCGGILLCKCHKLFAYRCILVGNSLLLISFYLVKISACSDMADGCNDLALMKGARLGIAAQSVGVSEAAYREALDYARDRPSGSVRSIAIVSPAQTRGR